MLPQVGAWLKTGGLCGPLLLSSHPKTAIVYNADQSFIQHRVSYSVSQKCHYFNFEEL